jgi:homoserine dehydrogenase
VVGDTLHYGQGAGPDATASAVLSDIGDAVLDLKHGSTDRLKAFIPHESNGAVRQIGETTSCYYLRLSVLDRPGVLAKVSAILAKNKIGISSVTQPEGHEGGSVPLILMLHYAKNAAMTKALKAIRKLSSVKTKPVMIRVESLE